MADWASLCRSRQCFDHITMLCNYFYPHFFLKKGISRKSGKHENFSKLIWGGGRNSKAFLGKCADQPLGAGVISNLFLFAISNVGVPKSAHVKNNKGNNTLINRQKNRRSRKETPDDDDAKPWRRWSGGGRGSPPPPIPPPSLPGAELRKRIEKRRRRGRPMTKRLSDPNQASLNHGVACP